MKRKLPLIGYISHWPSRRIVKVRVSKTTDPRAEYPLKVISLESNVNIGNGRIMYPSSQLGNGFYIVSLDVITLYKTRRAAEKDTLKTLHDEYAAQRRLVRKDQKNLKFALKRVSEWKAFKQVLTIFNA